jgi:hypothetical protein
MGFIFKVEKKTKTKVNYLLYDIVSQKKEKK